MTTPVGMNAVLTLADDVSVQSVGDGAVVLRARSGQLYTCNEITEAFLAKVDGSRSLAEIVALFCEEFDVDRDTAEKDLQALALDLTGEGILTPS